MGIKAINLGKYSKYLGLLLLIGLSTSLVRSYQKAAKTKALVEREKKKIEELKSQNEKFIEKQLRDRLGLAKAGEIILVLPDAETLKKLAPKVGEEVETLPDPPWKKWVDLFF